MELWICGQWIENEQWEFQGVFDSEQKAIDACTHDNYFIAKVTLNEPFPHETCSFDLVYYPRLQKKPHQNSTQSYENYGRDLEK